MENSHIQWCDNTQNFWIGCTKVSAGCAHCYAEARDKRFAEGIHWGKGAPRQRTSASNWREPLKWSRAAAEAINDFEGHKALHGGFAHYDEPRRPRVFCSSLSDIFDAEVPIEWFADAMDVIRQCTELNWLLLTKRPDNWATQVEAALKWIEAHEDWPSEHDANRHRLEPLRNWLADWFVLKKAPQNIWMGTSVENQETANERVPRLVAIPAKIRFLSCEPLLGPVDFSYEGHVGGMIRNGVQWVIIGGESGGNARPFNCDWARSLVTQCRAAGVSPFIKQLGSAPFEHIEDSYVGAEKICDACDMPMQLNDRKGGDMSEWPSELRVREFPK